MDAASEKVLFRHLPKTAGTSLITTLANVYGEERCRRFDEVDASVAEQVRDTSGGPRGGAVLLSGHISLTTVAMGSCADEFTVLREPIARLLSMRRFFERLPAAQRDALGLSARIRVDDLLDCRHPHVFGQVRGGITRFFAGSHALADPASPAFWSADFPADAAAAAARTLERMAVGTVEDMPATLRAIARRLRIPYDLEAPTENATNRADEDASVDDLRALVEVNAVDVALHHAVVQGLARGRGEGPSVAERGHDPRTLFAPSPGGRYAPPRIPGRQGFEICRLDAPVSWIGPTGRARIHLAPSVRPLKFSVVMFAVSPRYPVERVTFRVDGLPWSRSLVRGPGHEVFRLDTIPAHAGVLELAIEQPAAVPVAIVDPETADDRCLGVALLEIGCDAV